jgi:tetratricopeptide (TPR) repeat protein/transglutaminase-like putative cysteine protease
MRRLICVACAVLCSVSIPAARQPPASRAEEAAVIEQVRTAIRYENDGTGRRDVYMRIKAQSEAGVQQWGQVVLGYNAATERLEIPFVRVTKPDGSVVATSSQAVQDLSSPVQRVAPVYTDFRQKHVTVESFRPGDTLEVNFVTTIHTPLAPGQFWTEYNFTDTEIVLDERLEIDVPASRRVTLKVEPGFDPVTTDADGRRVYRWTHAHTVREEKKDEDGKAKAAKPDDEPERAAVRLTTFADWSEVGSWFAGLERAARVPTPEIAAKAKQLTEGRASDMDKLEALYDFVSKDFRYVSLSLGAGRYQPRAAGEVLREAYGDCKDKHTLLASLIDAAGLRASPVLINSKVKIDPDFPSPSQFDHVITRAMVGGEAVWLDATPEVAPFRLLSFGLRKKQALVSESGGGSRLEETPADAPVPARLGTTVRGTLSEAGTLTADVRITSRGDIELPFRLIFRGTPKPQWKDVVEGMTRGSRLDGKVSEVSVSDPQATREPFSVAFRIEVERFADIAGKETTIALPMDSIRNDADLPEPPESGTIPLGMPGQVAYDLELTVPAAVTVRAGIPVDVTRDYGDYHAAYGVKPGVVTVQRALRTSARELPESRRGDYAAFRRVLASDLRQQLTIDGTALAPVAVSADAEAKSLARSAYDALQEGDYEKAATLYQRAIAADPKAAGNRTNLARALLALRRPADALEPLRKEVELNPYDEFAYFYLGRAHVALREYAQAEAAFNRQLEINPLDRYAPAALGSMYLEQKAYVKAAAAYEKAAAINPKDAYTQVQLGRAYLNLRRNDEAMEAFSRSVKLSPTPSTWNNISYYLSVAGVGLDRAQQYAESAVAAQSAESRNLDVERADARALDVVDSLANYWDTLGWVHFVKGDPATAEKYVAASWRLDQAPEVGDHLAQIYEKTGRGKEAIALYAQAAAGRSPSPDVREHLARAAGADKADALIAAHRADLEKIRTIALDAKGPAGKKADFFVLFAPGGVDGVKFVEGDEELRALAPSIHKIRPDGFFPDAPAARLLRRGVAACTPAGCTLTLLLPEDARPLK